MPASRTAEAPSISTEQDIRTGRVFELIPGGWGAVRDRDEVVLVPDVLPGELVRFRRERRRRGAWHGRCVEILEASPDRCPPPCPAAGQCGGCMLQHLSRNAQAECKSGWVKTAFRELMGKDCLWLPADSPLAKSRRRVRWHVRNEGGRAVLGFRARFSHRVVASPECPVLDPALEELARALPGWLSLTSVASVQAVRLADGIHLVLEAPCRPEAERALPRSIHGLWINWWWRREQQSRPLDTRRFPIRTLHDEIRIEDEGGETRLMLEVGPDDFVQGQEAGNRALVSLLARWAGRPSRIVDLFCGIGNLGIPLAARFGAALVGAELHAASVQRARRNAGACSVAGEFHALDLFRPFNAEPFAGADLLILDPPRRGARLVCSQMARMLPSRILMVSCDPASGARDGALLRAAGYRLTGLAALDLFPWAGHVEAVSRWELG